MKTKLKHCDGPCDSLKSIWANKDGKKYCQSCWSKIKPSKPLNRTPIAKSQAPIPKRSDKRKKQEIAYSALRKVFLDQHSVCQAKISPDCKLKATECHHKAGRIGDLLCDDSKFLAVCTPCHQYIENNREQAIELGFSELRTNK